MKLFFIIIFPALVNCIIFDARNATTGVSLVEVGKGFLTFDDWNIYYYHNISEFFTKIDILTEAAGKLKLICENNAKLTDKIMCSNLHSTIQRHTEEIHSDRTVIEGYRLQPQTPRKKRFAELPPPKSYQHPVSRAYGLATRNDTVRLNDKINQLIGRTITSENLTSEQMNIFASTMKYQSAEFELFRKKVNDFEDYLETVRHLGDIAQYQLNQQNIYYLVTMCTSLYSEIQRTSYILVTMLSNSKDASTLLREMIPDHVFKEHIYEIQYGLDDKEVIPYDYDNDNVYDLYRIIKTYTQLVENRLIVQVRIPIVRDVKYKIIKINPIPFRTSKGLFIATPQYEYMFSSQDDVQAVPFTPEELSECLVKADESKICETPSPILLNTSRTCEMGLLFGTNQKDRMENCRLRELPRGNYITSLDNSNHYYIHIEESANIKQTCPARTEQFSISISGYLTVEPRCSVRMDGFLVISHDYSINENKTYDNTPSNMTQILILNQIPIVNTSDPIPYFNHTGLMDRIETIRQEIREHLNSSDLKIEPLYAPNEFTYKWFDFAISTELTLTIIVTILMVVYLIFMLYYYYAKLNSGTGNGRSFWRNSVIDGNVSP